LICASDCILDFSIRSEFVGYHDMREVYEELIPWAKKTRRNLNLLWNG